MFEFEKGDPDNLKGQVFIYSKMVDTRGNIFYYFNISSEGSKDLEGMLEEGSINEEERKEIIKKSKWYGNHQVYCFHGTINKPPEIRKINIDVIRFGNVCFADQIVPETINNIGLLYLRVYKLHKYKLAFKVNVPEEEETNEIDAASEFDFYSELMYKLILKGKERLLKSVIEDFEDTFSHNKIVSNFIDYIKTGHLSNYDELRESYHSLLKKLEEDKFEEAQTIIEKINKLFKE